MKTICVPAYANLFMANFELKYISLYRRDKTKMFLSLLLLMIWTGSEQELLDFMNDLSKKYPSIKFRIQRLTNKNWISRCSSLLKSKQYAANNNV